MRVKSVMHMRRIAHHHNKQYSNSLLLFLLTSIILFLSFISFLYANNYEDNVTVRAQSQSQSLSQTRQGLPLALLPGITGNVLATVSILISTSSFILGLKIQSLAKTPSTSSTIIDKYFNTLILSLVIPSIVIDVYGILAVGSHLYTEDTPYLLLLFVLFIPIGAILFLVKKLH
jgi:hypothetical protein